MQGGLYRQAAQCFDRVRALATNDLTSRMWLAQLNLMAGLPDKALVLTKEIRANPKAFALTSTNRNDLLALDASAYFTKNEPEKAVEIIEGELQRQPRDTLLLATAARLYTDRGYYSNAQVTLDRQLKITPGDSVTLINKGVVHVRAKEYAEGIKLFTRLLATQTNNSLARFNRAIAYLQSDKLDDAKQDYEILQTQFPESFQVYFGLGEIAYRRKDTNAAIKYYESYLSNSAPTTAEAQTVITRLQELKGESP
jgi:tetratricopeptide (TPR) repeat protein